MKTIFTGLLSLFLIIGFHPVKGQESDSLYVEGPALFTCNLQFPGNYNSREALPLVISLHGGGSSYNSFRNIWNHLEHPQFIMATPQAPYMWLIEGMIGYDWSAWPTGDLIVMQKALKLTTDYIRNIIISLTGKYNISEVYLLGFSQGAIIAQVAGINNHDIIKGIIILSGPELNHPGKPEIVWPPEETIQTANHLSVFIAHGKSDEIVDIEYAYKSRVQYEENGYNVTIFEFSGGHEINAQAMNEIEKWINKMQ